MQLLLFLLRSPVFWVFLLLLLVGIHYYNKLIRAKSRVDAALEDLEGLLQRHLSPLDMELPLVEVPEPFEGEPLPPAERWQARLQRLREGERLLFSKWESNEMMDNSLPSKQSFESKQAEATRHYNQQVETYNYLLESFPSGILAGMLNLEPRPRY